MTVTEKQNVNLHEVNHNGCNNQRQTSTSQVHRNSKTQLHKEMPNVSMHLLPLLTMSYGKLIALQTFIVK